MRTRNSVHVFSRLKRRVGFSMKWQGREPGARPTQKVKLVTLKFLRFNEAVWLHRQTLNSSQKAGKMEIERAEGCCKRNSKPGMVGNRSRVRGRSRQSRRPGPEGSANGERQAAPPQRSPAKTSDGRLRALDDTDSCYSPPYLTCLKSPSDTMKSGTNFIIFHDRTEISHFFKGRWEEPHHFLTAHKILHLICEIRASIPNHTAVRWILKNQRGGPHAPAYLITFCLVLSSH